MRACSTIAADRSLAIRAVVARFLVCRGSAVLADRTLEALCVDAVIAILAARAVFAGCTANRIGIAVGTGTRGWGWCRRTETACRSPRNGGFAGGTWSTLRSSFIGLVPPGDT